MKEKLKIDTIVMLFAFSSRIIATSRRKKILPLVEQQVLSDMLHQTTDAIPYREIALKK
ncbi:hypothetical protein LW858_30475 (plasmid) [Bacillus cereus]|uniref:hypothetical protein n=1 Tax=Bacillus cereus TaxID=1396 RepID=UPI001F3B866B|nr:hypothetical protein [Bacillus cereus]UIJ69546.1 hypothetical protein LW858_30475 [Bacillus cereus]